MTNAACCSIPPVTTHGYKPQGHFEEIANLNCYVVGDKTAVNQLVAVFDIFGFFPQVQQGADLLAAQGYRVVMPDFFKGQPFPHQYFPAYSSPMKALPHVPIERKQELMEFMGGAADFSKRQPELQAIADQLKKDGAQKIGAYGLCWGGKLVILSAVAKTFDAIAQIHPARLEPHDADNLTVPIASFISDDESIDAQNKLMEIANKKEFASLNQFHHYAGLHHGFAGSRADLTDPKVAAAFEDVYNRINSFFKAAL
ncbi:hypothetical protein HDU87_003440 [Geranomyces variabilis]|uniref:Dienelactone hydrolase domain-containing protein n=1 Tax=Geranomyces variabilis TaxID=109894 RepID=A0AAD5XRB2_9FUNG|nr:hypothetical protein HDU87_003440 [Geranomyces variabilis]